LIIDDRVMFTSDTRFDSDLVIEYDQKFNFELIIHDCQFFKGGVHASLEELETLPSAIKSKMLLVHYGDNYEQFKDRVAQNGFLGFVEKCVFYSFDV